MENRFLIINGKYYSVRKVDKMGLVISNYNSHSNKMEYFFVVDMDGIDEYIGITIPYDNDMFKSDNVYRTNTDFKYMLECLKNEISLYCFSGTITNFRPAKWIKDWLVERELWQDDIKWKGAGHGWD